MSSRMERLKGHHLDQQGRWDRSVLIWEWLWEGDCVEVMGFAGV